MKEKADRPGTTSLRQQAERAAEKLASRTINQAAEGVQTLLQTWSALPIPPRLRPHEQSAKPTHSSTPAPIGSDGTRPNSGVSRARLLTQEEIRHFRKQIQAALEGRERIRPLILHPDALSVTTPDEKKQLLQGLLRLPPSFSRAQGAFSLLSSCTSRGEWEQVTEGLTFEQWEQWSSQSGAAEQCRILWKLWERTSTEPAMPEIAQPLPRLTPPPAPSRVERMSNYHKVERHRQWFDLLQEPRRPRLLQVLQTQRVLEGLSPLDWTEVQTALFALFEDTSLRNSQLSQAIEELRQKHQLSTFAMRSLFLERVAEIYDSSAASLHTQATRLYEQDTSPESGDESEAPASLLETEVPFLLKRARLARRMYPMPLTAREELAELLLLLHKVLLQLLSYLEPSLQGLPPLQRSMLLSVQLLPFVSQVMEGDQQGIRTALQVWLQLSRNLLSVTVSQARRLGGQALESTRSLLQATQAGQNLSELLDRWQNRGQTLQKQAHRTQKLVGMNKATGDVLVGLKDGSIPQTREGVELWTQHALSLVQDVSQELLQEHLPEWEQRLQEWQVEEEVSPTAGQELKLSMEALLAFLRWLWGSTEERGVLKAGEAIDKEPALEELLQFLDEGLLWFHQWVIQREKQQQQTLTQSAPAPSLSPGAASLLESLEQLREYLEERTELMGSLQNYSQQLWQRWKQEEKQKHLGTREETEES